MMAGAGRAQTGVAKRDFLRCFGADQILIENAERFARIDLDSVSDFEKERAHCVTLSILCDPMWQVTLRSSDK